MEPSIGKLKNNERLFVLKLSKNSKKMKPYPIFLGFKGTPPLVVERANTSLTGEGCQKCQNASSTRGGCQRQALVFDAKCE
jgi:hypothetical protein